MDRQIEPDLPPNLACLKNVDTLLRCPICFDFFNITMMSKCSHNFCSLCIRKFLSYKLQCPVCNTQMTEQDLRNNRLLDELVVSFQAARQQLSKATFDSPPISPKTPSSAVKCKTPRERGQKCNSSVLSHFFQKKPKTSQSKEIQRGVSVDQHVQTGKIQTVQSHNANDADLHSGRAQLPVVVKEEPMEVENSSVNSLISVKREDDRTETAHSSSLIQDVKPIIKVECPVCSVSVSQHFINKHLDICLARDEKKESLRSSLGKTVRPMGKLVYNLLSMQELKRKVKECHMSVKGTRDQLIKRHQEFVHLYNSQCDSLNPKSALDIAKEVEANEKMRHQLQDKTKHVMVFSKNQSEEEINEIHSNYRKQHSSDFSRLIAQVRGRLETTRQTRVTPGGAVDKEEAQSTHTADEADGSKSSIMIKVEDGEGDDEQSTRGIEFPSSPTTSDVSISSSISDIFGPDPVFDVTERPLVKKRRLSSTLEDSASPVTGKHQRKS